MRIKEHPILGTIKKGKEIRFVFDGKPLTAYEGDTIAAALWANGIKVARYTKEKNHARGLFCAIGYCSDCMMIVNGKPNVRTCVTLVEPDMTVETQISLGEWGDFNA
jgi:predicted molibdopterin-dependent oxidoreductase YjgC